MKDDWRLHGDDTGTRVLAPLAKFYDDDSIEEIVLNRPGEVWVHPRGGHWEVRQADNLDYDDITRILRVLANINNSKFDELSAPVVSCTTPLRPFRFQGLAGPNVRFHKEDREGCGVAIRSLVQDQRINFKSYGLESGIPLAGARQVLETGLDDEGDLRISDDHIEKILNVIDRHLSIIVSGRTSTGKTTFLGKLVQLIDHSKRLVSVEDTLELDIPHPNRLRLWVPRQSAVSGFNWSSAIDSLMRLTPDVIFIGELSMTNSAATYKALGTGHPICATVHAGTTDGAISAIARNIGMDPNTTLNADKVVEALAPEIGAIVQIEKGHDGKRRVVDIAFPADEHAAKEQAAAKQNNREPPIEIRTASHTPVPNGENFARGIEAPWPLPLHWAPLDDPRLDRSPAGALILAEVLTAAVSQPPGSSRRVAAAILAGAIAPTWPSKDFAGMRERLSGAMQNGTPGLQEIAAYPAGCVDVEIDDITWKLSAVSAWHLANRLSTVLTS